MTRKRIDYNQIAPTYDQRYANKDGNRETATALASLTQKLGAQGILEVGCGTGHWMAELLTVAPQVYGVDLSPGMLHQARERRNILNLILGRASRLPFSNASFEMIFCVNALHHFQHQPEFITEARRLLRPGGTLAVIGMDPRLHRDTYYFYDYFEGMYQTDLGRFPSWGTVLDWMAANHFESVEWQTVERIVDHKRGSEVLNDPYLQKHSQSQLALLSDEAYAAGIRRIEEALTRDRSTGDTLVFPVDITLAMMIGRLKE
jgi:ubiquinone/menaquinone biosynthesis C-methylase UbiE